LTTKVFVNNADVILNKYERMMSYRKWAINRMRLYKKKKRDEDRGNVR